MQQRVNGLSLGCCSIGQERAGVSHLSSDTAQGEGGDLCGHATCIDKEVQARPRVGLYQSPNHYAETSYQLCMLSLTYPLLTEINLFLLIYVLPRGFFTFLSFCTSYFHCFSPLAGGCLSSCPRRVLLFLFFSFFAPCLF